MQSIRSWRYERLIHLGILATIFLIPVWLRPPALRPPNPSIFPPIYVTQFLIFLPMIWTIFWWLALGLPGLRDGLRSGSRSKALWALALLALALWGFASQWWGFQRQRFPEVGQSAALQLGVSTLFAVVVACAAPSRRAVTAALALAVIPNALIAIIQAHTQGDLGMRWLGEFPFNLGAGGASILESGDWQWVRPYGLLPHPNILGGALLIGLFAAGAWVLSTRRWQQVLGIGIVALGWWALLLTFSRSAWVGAVVGGLALVLFLRPHGRRVDARVAVAVTVGVMVAIGLAFALAYQPLLMARAGEGQEGVEQRSISDRIVFTEYALRSIRERPLFGVGVGYFPWRMSYYLAETDFDLRGDNVHNVGLSVAAELGIVGAGLFVLSMACGIVAVVRGLRAVQDDDRAARLMLFAAVLAVLAIGFFDHYPWTTIHFQVATWGLLAAAMPATPAADH